MNAAFVILASAMLGNHPAAAPCNTCSAPAPAPACATCSSWSGHSLRSQLSGLFSCHSCKTETPCAAPCPTPCPAPACDSCGGHGQLFGRFRGLFSHHSSCDSCSAPACDGCASAPAAPAGEGIKDAPKKMPEAPKGDAPKGDKAVRFEETPEAPLAIPALNPAINARPAVIVAPATLRNPF